MRQASATLRQDYRSTPPTTTPVILTTRSVAARFAQLRDESLESQRKAKRSIRHQQDLRDRLGRFIETFGDRPVRVLRADEIEDWLHGLNLSPAERIGAVYDLSTGFSTNSSQ